MKATLKISEVTIVKKMIEFDIADPSRNIFRLSDNKMDDESFERLGYVCIGWVNDPNKGEVHIWAEI